ncbi:hypothetical protein [Zavarzinia sp. CC-PAN008]
MGKIEDADEQLVEPTAQREAWVRPDVSRIPMIGAAFNPAGFNSDTMYGS